MSAVDAARGLVTAARVEARRGELTPERAETWLSRLQLQLSLVEAEAAGFRPEAEDAELEALFVPGPRRPVHTRHRLVAITGGLALPEER